MTVPPPRSPAPRSSTADLGAVVAELRRRSGPARLLDLARVTGVSTLVIVPELGNLQRRGLVSRRVIDDPRTGTAVWGYQLTPRGRRDLRPGR